MKSQAKERAKTVAKLFFVMGLTWIAEIISWMLGKYLEHTVLIVKISMFFDCLNALQGFTLFCALFFDHVRIILYHENNYNRFPITGVNRPFFALVIETSSCFLSVCFGLDIEPEGYRGGRLTHDNGTGTVNGTLL
jgi:hypothetical protein